MRLTNALRWLVLMAFATGSCVVLAESSAKRDECRAYCDRAQAECSSAARKAKTQCARNAATGGVDPMTMRRNESAYFCGYFNGNHCGYSSDPSRCVERFRRRYDLCMDAYTESTTQLYSDCNASERDAIALCREELGDCRSSCP